MSDTCSSCGKSFSGFMSVKHVCGSTLRDFAPYGKDVSSVCEKCCEKLKGTLIKEVENRKKQLSIELEETKNLLLPEISVSTTPHDHKYDKKIRLCYN